MTATAVAISSIAHSLPDRVVTTDEVAARFVDAGGSPVLSASALRRLTGVDERRHVAPGECSSDLAARAGDEAIRRAGLDPGDIDIVIFASASHDVAEPATANRVQAILGCTRARVLDVKNACNSFVDGLDVAGAMLQRQPHLRILVANGEVISPFIRWQSPSRAEATALIAGLTLGDAGAAAVVSADVSSALAVVGASSFRSLGEHWASSRILGGGSMEGQDFAQAYFWSDSAQLYALAVEHIPPMVKSVLAGQGWDPADIDLIVPHQASAAITRRVCDHFEVPFSRCVITGPHLGNTAAASIPVALSVAHESGRLGADTRTLLVGGAAGFSAACIALTGPSRIALTGPSRVAIPAP